MDDDALIETYGNFDLPKGTPDRPLVTFAVFAYNQERYIREAVEGAFAQTYSPLEIVLSDDGSSDETFEIMRLMALNYNGIHKVILRRSVKNLGVIDHVISVTNISSGSLVIVAAGDDISYPQRTDSIVSRWLESQSMALFSAVDVISDNGEVLQRGFEPPTLDGVQEIFRGCSKPIRYEGRVRNVPGYSAAYSKVFLEKFVPVGRVCNKEDALFSYSINLLGGGIEYIPQALMSRRESRTSISGYMMNDSLEELKKRELKLAELAKSTIILFEYLKENQFLCEEKDFEKFIENFSRRIRFMKIVAGSSEQGPLQNIKRLLKIRDIESSKFIVARLFGVSGLYFLIKTRSAFKNSNNSERHSLL